MGQRRRRTLLDKQNPSLRWHAAVVAASVTRLLFRGVWAQTGVRRAAPQQRSGAGRATPWNPRMCNLALVSAQATRSASSLGRPGPWRWRRSRQRPPTCPWPRAEQQVLGQADNLPSRGPHRQVHRIPHLGAEPSRETVSTRHGTARVAYSRFH